MRRASPIPEELAPDDSASPHEFYVIKVLVHLWTSVMAALAPRQATNHNRDHTAD